MSEKTTVNAKTASVFAAGTPRTKTAEKAARELAERKMAELAYAENYRQKLREEKAAKKSEEVKEAEKKAAEKREAESKERRRQMEEVLKKEREEMAARNAKADAVLQMTDKPVSEPVPAEKPKKAPTPVAAPKPSVKPAKKPASASDFSVKAPIGSFIPFEPKPKTAKKRTPATFKAPSAASLPKRPTFETLFSTYSVSAGRPVDYVTLEELFASYQAEQIKPDLQSREVQDLLDEQKRQSQKEIDALLENFLQLLNEQKAVAERANEEKAVIGEEEAEEPEEEISESYAADTETEEAGFFVEQEEEPAEEEETDYEEPETEEDELPEGSEADEEAEETAEEDELPEGSEADEEDETAGEDELPEEAEPATGESADDKDSLFGEKWTEEDTLWVEEEMVETDDFAVIPEDLGSMKRHKAVQYVRSEWKQLRKDVKEEKKHLAPAKTATEDEKRRALYESIGLCRSTVENCAVLLKLSVANHMDGSDIAQYMDDQITLEHKLIRKLKKKCGRSLKPTSKKMILTLLKKKKKEITPPALLYRNEFESEE